jgi:hypothetical protein
MRVTEVEAEGMILSTGKIKTTKESPENRRSLLSLFIHKAITKRRINPMEEIACQ